MSAAALHVVRPGLLTTVQDLGRWGCQAEGVPVAGPMDWFSHRLANQLVGNAPDAATLEITLTGPELLVDADVVGAVAGADFDVTCDAAAVAMHVPFDLHRGARLSFGRRRAGARAYLALAGGIRTEPVLGSRATHIPSGMGGVDGRALVPGDVLPLAPGERTVRRRRAADGLALPCDGYCRVRVRPGAQADMFLPSAWATLTTASFVVSSRSNRMGYRLNGPALPYGSGGDLITEPLAQGAIQVPAAGEPILLMADRQTAGGYPKLATAIAADLPVLGQLAPGDRVTFIACTRAEAADALIARERHLLRHVVAEAS